MRGIQSRREGGREESGRRMRGKQSRRGGGRVGG